MKYSKKIGIGIWIEVVVLLLAGISGKLDRHTQSALAASDGEIKWVDFNVSYEALCQAYEADTATYGQPVHIEWIPLLSYTAAKNGGEFKEAALKDMEHAVAALKEKTETMASLTKNLKAYDYYLEAYGAVLDGYVGAYETPDKKKAYGLKVFSPIAKGFEYRDYDDFGVSRSFGYKREHLGHDMLGQIGTPIIAVESGEIEALGWNRYGGWRIGIRSSDKKRYYYYAHLRQNAPYAEGLKEGQSIEAGEVIGYMGHTGYSDTENVNNIDEVHLHFGLELVFDEAQKDGDTQIWIDCYNLTRFLCRNRAEVEKIGDTKEWHRKNEEIK